MFFFINLNIFFAAILGETILFLLLIIHLGVFVFLILEVITGPSFIDTNFTFFPYFFSKDKNKLSTADFEEEYPGKNMLPCFDRSLDI